MPQMVYRLFESLRPERSTVRVIDDGEPVSV